MVKNYNNNDTDDHESNRHSDPVTVIVKRIAKKDKTQEFEEWLSRISKEVARQEGFMGTDIIRPASDASKLEYVIIFRFDNYDNLSKWEKSSIRNEMLQRFRNY